MVCKAFLSRVVWSKLYLPTPGIILVEESEGKRNSVNMLQELPHTTHWEWLFPWLLPFIKLHLSSRPSNHLHSVNRGITSNKNVGVSFKNGLITINLLGEENTAFDNFYFFPSIWFLLKVMVSECFLRFAMNSHELKIIDWHSLNHATPIPHTMYFDLCCLRFLQVMKVHVSSSSFSSIH